MSAYRSTSASTIISAAAAVTPVPVPYSLYDDVKLTSDTLMLPVTASPDSSEAGDLPAPFPPFDAVSVTAAAVWWLQPVALTDITPSLSTTAESLAAMYVDPFADLRRRAPSTQQPLLAVDTSLYDAFHYDTPTAPLPSTSEFASAFCPNVTTYEAIEQPSLNVADNTPMELWEAAAAALLSTSPSASTIGPVRKPSSTARQQQRRRATTLDAVSGSMTRLNMAATTSGNHACLWTACRCTFASVEELAAHISTEHIPRRASSLQCGWHGCKRSDHAFQHRDKLMLHLRLHIGYKPYQCTHAGCGKAFSRSDSLEGHLKTHAADGRQHACKACGKSYFHAKSLRKHAQTCAL